MLFQRPTQNHLPHKTSTKMKQNNHSLQAFEAEVLNHLYQLSLETYSFSWIHKCLRILPNIDNAFVKFVVEVDHPVNEWSGFIVEEYLKDNTSLLDNLNCISSDINHLSQVCIELSYSLSIVEGTGKLKEILPWCCKKKLEDPKEVEEEEEEEKLSEKELMVHKALLIRKRVKNWIYKIVDSSIRGDVGHEERFCNSAMASLQAGVLEGMKKRGSVKEIGEINKSVIRILAAAKEGRKGQGKDELRERVEVLGKLLDGIKEDVNKLFSEGLVRRNELVHSFAQRKQ